MNTLRKEDIAMFNSQLPVFPTVSIIVPVYNAEKNVDTLITSLLNLDYPKELLEIILVDNNSNDRTKEVIRRYPVKLLEETRIQSSYAARNKGIKNAKHEILAFTDSDCMVTPQWVREGVTTLISKSADLAGGRVAFIYSKQKTAAELYDSITNLHTESSIERINAATTANLLVKSFLFEHIGLFPDSVTSGGDIQWTSRATKAGFILAHAPDAIVYHPTRRLKELLKKDFRVGTGLLDVFVNTKKPLPGIVFSLAKLFFPRRLSSLRKAARERGVIDADEKIFRLWCISYVCNISRILGILSSVGSIYRKRNKIPSNLILKNNTLL